MFERDRGVKHDLFYRLNPAISTYDTANRAVVILCWKHKFRSAAISPLQIWLFKKSGPFYTVSLPSTHNNIDIKSSWVCTQNI